jgi:hypothetical protein
MSFQAYLDTIEKKTGLTPRELLEIAKARGFDGPAVKANDVVAWLAADYGLGRGHAMALVHVIKHGPGIDPSTSRAPEHTATSQTPSGLTASPPIPDVGPTGPERSRSSSVFRERVPLRRC